MLCFCGLDIGFGFTGGNLSSYVDIVNIVAVKNQRLILVGLFALILIADNKSCSQLKSVLIWCRCNLIKTRWPDRDTLVSEGITSLR